MNLPLDASSFFITAEGSYCHILPENIVITTHTQFKELPPSEDKKNWAALLLGGLGVAFGTFLMVQFFIVTFYLMAFLFFIGMFYATKVLADVARFSTIKNMERKNVEGIKMVTPKFGYSYLIIRFRNETGTSSLRKIKLYDSVQNEQNTIRILSQNGLLSA